MKKKQGRGASAPDGIVTPPFVLSFNDLYDVSDLSGEYEIMMLFDEDKVDLSAMKQNLREAAEDLWGNKKPAKLLSPFTNGDELFEQKGWESVQGKTVVKAKSGTQPAVFDANMIPITDPQEIYSGCLCRAVLHGYAYDNMYNKGVRFNLVSVQKLRDGQRLGGGPRVNSQEKLSEAGDADLSAFDDMDFAARDMDF